MGIFLKTLGVIFASQALIMCGIYFISGLLMKSWLQPVYESTSSMARLLIALVVSFAAGNMLMAFAFKTYPPAYTAPVTMFSMVLLQVVFAVAAFRLPVTPWLAVATFAVAASCVWVSLLLQPPAG